MSGHGSGRSNVGARNIYESDDQRTVPQSELEKAQRYDEGQRNAHKSNDSKDQRSIANRLAAEERRVEPEDDLDTARLHKDPTLPAKMHGNEPSKGAQIDAELMADDEERIKQKNKAK
ncbi:hypothetical protein CCMA1212_007178 [Trichoderma ghanense]|uniref:Uncharacterized protein n=1 Tax=Trichoderma ghanense TaxID=65468 RepID=A0ABY2GYD7_9HYPO